MTSPRRAWPLHDEAPLVNNDQMSADSQAVWTRHGAIAAGERVDGFVQLVSTVRYDPDGTEYRRVYRFVPTSATRGESEQLLLDGLEMLTTQEANRL